jgi:hypothetical protein
MKNNVKTKIIVTVVFLGVGVACIFATDYIATYYENIGKKVPRWIYYATFAVLGLAYMIFAETFSDGKDDKKGGRR